MLKKRIVCVPLSVEAEHRLDYDDSLEGDLEELALTQGEFDHFYDTGSILIEGKFLFIKITI